MAATMEPQKVASAGVEDDLSDEQIEALLARATARLQKKSKGKEVAKPTGPQYTFPKLNPGGIEKPYVSEKGEVATLDSARLLEEKDRKQANGIRQVVDPVVDKKMALEVRCLTYILTTCWL